MARAGNTVPNGYAAHHLIPTKVLNKCNLIQEAIKRGIYNPNGCITYNTMPGISVFRKHHIIPQQLADHGAMKTAGMNIHKASNIICLPTQAENHSTRTIHGGSHPQYTASVEKKLDMVHDYGQKNGWSKTDYN